MKLLSQNLKTYLALVLSAGLVFFYPISAMSMNHDTMTAGFSMLHMSMNGQSILPSFPVSDASQCIDFHLGILHKISESSPLSTSLAFSIVFILALLIISLVARHLLQLLDKHSFSKYQRLKPVSLKTFFEQLGFWLTLTEKKNPAYAFATA